MNDSWEDFKELFSVKFNISPTLVDYIAVFDILDLCASGYSNSTISRRLEMDILYIQDVLESFLNFGGFKSEVDFNPFSVYSRTDSFDEFEKDVKLVAICLDIDLKLCYNICIKFDKIRKELDSFYGTN